METGYRFKYFDLNMVRPDAPYRDFLALSRNTPDERAAVEPLNPKSECFVCFITFLFIPTYEYCSRYYSGERLGSLYLSCAYGEV